MRLPRLCVLALRLLAGLGLAGCADKPEPVADEETPVAGKAKPTSQEPKPGRLPNGYGLSRGDPVLCGGGPSGERDYLNSLRCPCGMRVKYQRLGSTLTTDVGFLNKPGVCFDPGARPDIPEEMEEFFSPDFRREETYSQEVPLDTYAIECERGEHRLKAVFMDMYHRGPVVPIGLEGWTVIERD